MGEYTTAPARTTPVREELTPEQRAEIRACLIHHDAKNALEFQAKAIRKYGAAGGIMCRELLFWDCKGHDPNGFVYLTKDEGERRMGLSAKSQDGGRKCLEDAGVLEVERRPRRNPDGSIKHPSPVLHYRLDLGVLFEQITGETLDHWFKHADADVRTRGSGDSSTPNGVLEHADTVASYTEGSSEVTSEVSLAGRAKPKKKRGKRKELASAKAESSSDHVTPALQSARVEPEASRNEGSEEEAREALAVLQERSPARTSRFIEEGKWELLVDEIEGAKLGRFTPVMIEWAARTPHVREEAS